MSLMDTVKSGSFMDAVKSGFDNYANFSGRAMRSEFWWWVLFGAIVGIVASIIDSILFDRAMIVQAVAGLALLVPNIAVSVRRLHDIGKSGWNVLWSFLPVLGWIYLIYLYVQPGTPAPNAYGARAAAMQST